MSHNKNVENVIFLLKWNCPENNYYELQKDKYISKTKNLTEKISVKMKKKCPG